MRWVLVGCVVIVGFDALGAAAAEQLDFPYEYLFPISLAIYGNVAFLAARERGRTAAGVIAGATVAFAEATVGWAVSWLIGPGKLEGDYPGTFIVTATIVGVVGTGALIGLIAGRIATRAKRAQGT
jgi:hypothetical protein